MNRKERRALAKQQGRPAVQITPRMRIMAERALAQADGHSERAIQLFAMEIERASMADPDIMTDVCRTLIEEVQKDRPDITDPLDLADEALRRLIEEPQTRKGHA